MWCRVSTPMTPFIFPVLPAIPGKWESPVTNALSLLAFRKHQCDNTPLAKTLGRFDDGVCHGDRGSQRAQTSFCRCALSLDAKRLCQPARLPPWRDGDFVNRCTDVSVRHVFPQIAFLARL